MLTNNKDKKNLFKTCLNKNIVNNFNNSIKVSTSYTQFFLKQYQQLIHYFHNLTNTNITITNKC